MTSEQRTGQFAFRRGWRGKQILRIEIRKSYQTYPLFETNYHTFWRDATQEDADWLQAQRAD